jgi:exosome complex exonuclease DIS3/RRP44
LIHPHSPQYFPLATILAGVKTGRLHQGHFNASQYNYLEARTVQCFFPNYVSRPLQGSVVAPSFSRPVLLIGRENMNRAVHGDVVAIEIFDEKDWKVPVDQVIDQEGALASHWLVFRILIPDQPP